MRKRQGKRAKRNRENLRRLNNGDECSSQTPSGRQAVQTCDGSGTCAVTCKNLETPPFEYISYAQAQAAASRAPVVACGRKYLHKLSKFDFFRVVLGRLDCITFDRLARLLRYR